MKTLRTSTPCSQREDARRRAEAIREVVAEGRKNGRPMTFIERVAASYDRVSKGQLS